MHNPPKIIKTGKQKVEIVKLPHAEEATRIRLSKFDSIGEINLVSEYTKAIDTQTPLSH